MRYVMRIAPGRGGAVLRADDRHVAVLKSVIRDRNDGGLDNHGQQAAAICERPASDGRCAAGKNRLLRRAAGLSNG